MSTHVLQRALQTTMILQRERERQGWQARGEADLILPTSNAPTPARVPTPCHFEQIQRQAPPPVLSHAPTQRLRALRYISLPSWSSQSQSTNKRPLILPKYIPLQVSHVGCPFCRANPEFDLNRLMSFICDACMLQCGLGPAMQTCARAPAGAIQLSANGSCMC